MHTPILTFSYKNITAPYWEIITKSPVFAAICVIPICIHEYLCHIIRLTIMNIYKESHFQIFMEDIR